VEAFMRVQKLDPDRRQEVVQWAFQKGNPGILEFRAPRGRGLAYRLSKQIAAQGWNIESARFGQWAGLGSAAFYVSGQDGGELTEEGIRTALQLKV